LADRRSAKCPLGWNTWTAAEWRFINCRTWKRRRDSGSPQLEPVSFAFLPPLNPALKIERHMQIIEQHQNLWELTDLCIEARTIPEVSPTLIGILVTVKSPIVSLIVLS
jgi:hypothetical protein